MKEVNKGSMKREMNKEDKGMYSITIGSSDGNKLSSTVITKLMYDCFDKKSKAEWLGNQIIELIEMLKKELSKK